MPVITPADFFVDADTDEVQTLVDSISGQAGQERLRQIAQRNLEGVIATSAHVPNARELVSAIWMRSISPEPVVARRRHFISILPEGWQLMTMLFKQS